MASVVETAPLVLNVGAVLLVAATSGLAARKVGLPAIVGYLVTGLLVSPFTPGLVAAAMRTMPTSKTSGAVSTIDAIDQAY